MHKVLILLGLLRRGPLSGYDLARIVRSHGELYSDLKKGNVYYLLDRLAADGYLCVEAQPGARGPRGERLIYSLTERGRERFLALLREVLRSYETVHIGVDAAIIFLGSLPPAEAVALLAERREVVRERQARASEELAAAAAHGLLARIAADHMRILIDAELTWVDGALAELRASDRE